jgi:hypothetical protein
MCPDRGRCYGARLAITKLGHGTMRRPQAAVGGSRGKASRLGRATAGWLYDYGAVGQDRDLASRRRGDFAWLCGSNVRGRVGLDIGPPFARASTGLGRLLTRGRPRPLGGRSVLRLRGLFAPLPVSARSTASASVTSVSFALPQATAPHSSTPPTSQRAIIFTCIFALLSNTTSRRSKKGFRAARRVPGEGACHFDTFPIALLAQA